MSNFAWQVSNMIKFHLALKSSDHVRLMSTSCPNSLYFFWLNDECTLGGAWTDEVRGRGFLGIAYWITSTLISRHFPKGLGR